MRKLWCYVVKVKDFFRYNLPYGIKNLCIWFPTIWHDRNYDHYFIYAILHKKLSRMERFIRLHGHHVDHLKDAAKIKTCVVLLKRLMDDEYHENAFLHHNRKWGEPTLEFKDIPDSNYGEILINRDGVVSEQDKELERKEFRTASDRERYLREQDKELLFKLMKKHIDSWWD